MADTTFTNAVTLTEAEWFNHVNDAIYKNSPLDWCGTAGGTANALTLTAVPAITAYATGQQFTFKAGSSSNTGATTVAVSGLSTIAVQFNGAACVGGEIQANKWYRITLDSATTCQLEGIGVSVEEDHWDFALSDETTAITTGTAKLSWYTPYAITLTTIPYAWLTTSSSSGAPTVDINEAGTTILGANKLSIDANELTSGTAATATTLADTALAAQALITFDIDTAGTGAKGLKVRLFGRRT